MSQILPFATLVFRGARFDGHVLPLEVLPELAAYRDLVIDVAKRLFKAANPERVRVRKHFEGSLQLVLGPVTEGSAATAVQRNVEAGWLLPPTPDRVDYFELAREVVEEAVACSSRGEPLPKSFPTDSVGKFNMFGKGLQPDEAIVLAPAGSLIGPTLTKEGRRKLLLRYQSKYEDEVELGGVVRAADHDGERFWVRTDGGQRVGVRCSPLFMPLVFRAGVSGDVRVSVTGTGVYDQKDNLLEVTNAELVAEEDAGFQSCPKPLREQLALFSGLDSGWMDGAGRGFSAESVEWFADLLDGLVSAFRLPNPFVYPTVEGLARAEWPTAEWEVSAELDPLERSCKAFAVQLTGEEVQEFAASLARPGAEAKLGAFIARFVGLNEVA